MSMHAKSGVPSQPPSSAAGSQAAQWRVSGMALASQLAGGAMEWLDPNPYFIKVPFPSSIDAQDRSFATFEARLKELGAQVWKYWL